MECKDYKFWKESDKNDYSKLIAVGYCKKAKMFWESTEWHYNDEALEVTRELKPEFKENGVFVQDGSDYLAYMITQPNFGCVKFETKDTNTLD